MSTSYSPRIVTDGLVLLLDAANPKSYPGTGTTWYDLSGNGYDFTLDSVNIAYNLNGYFTMTDGGFVHAGNISSSTTCTCVFWMYTSDTQALFWSRDGTGGYYLAAYRVGNKEYHSTVGVPNFYMDTNEKPNVYDYIRDGNWHMLEFKNVDFSNAWNNMKFNKYGSYTFGNGSGIAQVLIYNKNLSANESIQNYNALRSRFGI